MNSKDIHQALEILGLPSIVSRAEIKRRYRDLARRYHPDLNSTDFNKIQDINQAYEIVMEYVDNFRFYFDEEEINRQIPQIDHDRKFKI